MRKSLLWLTLCALLTGPAAIPGPKSFRAIQLAEFALDTNATSVPPDLLIALESELLSQLGKIKGCQLAVRKSSCAPLPRPALGISGTVLRLEKPSGMFVKTLPVLVAHVRFTDLDTGHLLHEADITGTRAVFGAIGELDATVRGFAKSLTKVTRTRFFP